MPLASITFEYINENTNIPILAKITHKGWFWQFIHACISVTASVQQSKNLSIPSDTWKGDLLQGSGKSFGNFIMPQIINTLFILPIKSTNLPSIEIFIPETRAITLTARNVISQAFGTLCLFSFANTGGNQPSAAEANKGFTAEAMEELSVVPKAKQAPAMIK